MELERLRALLKQAAERNRAKAERYAPTIALQEIAILADGRATAYDFVLAAIDGQPTMLEVDAEWD